MSSPAPNRWPIKALLIGVIIIAVFAIKPLKIIYHQSAVHKAWARVMDPAQTNAAMRDAALGDFARHRGKLVSLGYLVQKPFPLQHVQAASAEHRALHQALEQHGREARDSFFLLSGHQPGQPAAVTIWAPTSEMPGWEAVIHQLDQPPKEAPKAEAKAATADEKQ